MRGGQSRGAGRPDARAYRDRNRAPPWHVAQFRSGGDAESRKDHRRRPARSPDAGPGPVSGTGDAGTEQACKTRSVILVYGRRIDSNCLICERSLRTGRGPMAAEAATQLKLQNVEPAPESPFYI